MFYAWVKSGLGRLWNAIIDNLAISIAALIVGGIGLAFGQTFISYLNALSSVTIMPVTLPLWLIVLPWFGLLTIGIMIGMAFLLNSTTAIMSAYTSDTIDGVRWEWQWVKQRVHHLTPRCPVCNRLMVWVSYGISGLQLECEQNCFCKELGSRRKHDLEGRVEREIIFRCEQKLLEEQSQQGK